jgi:uncharacterized membrane protein
MATLTVLKFPSASGAEEMLSVLEGLQKQQLITIQDAAIVTWPVGKKKPKTRQLQSLTGFGALQGAFWGMLFGLLFFIPILGLAVGAGMGALAGSFADIGIDDKFIKEVRSKVTEGTSALFLMSSGAVLDRIGPSVEGMKAEVISTNLSKEEEDKIQAMFSEEE